MKMRIFSTVFVFVALVLPSHAQMKTTADIGIDEKLGAQVAMDTVLKDEFGRDVTLRQLIDKPTILMFNYFRCPGICPILINAIVEVINRMPLDPGIDYRLVAVSFDPTDRPETARQKKANYLNQMRRSFPPDAWQFLTGNEEDTKAIADSAGFNFRRQGDMYEHPGAIMVLTSKGILSRYLYGTSFLPADVAMALQEARRGQVRPTISRVLSFCYSYDPEGRRYVFNVTRLAGALTLVLVGVFTVLVVLRKKRV